MNVKWRKGWKCFLSKYQIIQHNLKEMGLLTVWKRECHNVCDTLRYEILSGTKFGKQVDQVIRFSGDEFPREKLSGGKQERTIFLGQYFYRSKAVWGILQIVSGRKIVKKMGTKG